MKCHRPGCANDAEFNSNYCSSHQPSFSPTQFKKAEQEGDSELKARDRERASPDRESKD
jgi:hypothetical protein